MNPIKADLIKCIVSYGIFCILLDTSILPTPAHLQMGWVFYALLAIPFVVLYLAFRLTAKMDMKPLEDPIPWDSYSWKKKIWTYIKINF